MIGTTHSGTDLSLSHQLAPTAFGGVFTFFFCAGHAEEFPAQPLEVLRRAAGVIILDHGYSPGRSFDNPRAGSDVRIEEVAAENAPYLLYELPVESPALVVIVEHDPDRPRRPRPESTGTARPECQRRRSHNALSPSRVAFSISSAPAAAGPPLHAGLSETYCE